MVSISDESKKKIFFDLSNKLNKHFNGDNKSEALGYTLDTEIQSTSGGDPLKIALHMAPDNNQGKLDGERLVELVSLTNPSVAVNFNANKTSNPDFNPDDKLFTALDFILRLVPKEFNSIETFFEPQDGDINISLGDYEEVTPYQYTINESGNLKFDDAKIGDLTTLKAPTAAA